MYCAFYRESELVSVGFKKVVKHVTTFYGNDDFNVLQKEFAWLSTHKSFKEYEGEQTLKHPTPSQQ